MNAKIIPILVAMLLLFSILPTAIAAEKGAESGKAMDASKLEILKELKDLKKYFVECLDWKNTSGKVIYNDIVLTTKHIDMG